VNGFPVKGHADVIQIINEASAANGEVLCLILPRVSSKAPFEQGQDDAPDQAARFIASTSIQMTSCMTHSTEGSTTRYTASFAKEADSWQVSYRYSEWRHMWDIVYTRWPNACQGIAFPPKAIPQRIVHPRIEALDARAHAIESVLRTLLSRSENSTEFEDLGHWLNYRLRDTSAEEEAAVASIASTEVAAEDAGHSGHAGHELLVSSTIADAEDSTSNLEDGSIVCTEERCVREESTDHVTRAMDAFPPAVAVDDSEVRAD